MEPAKEYVTIDNFKTISEFKERLIRGGEPMFEWNGTGFVKDKFPLCPLMRGFSVCRTKCFYPFCGL